MYTVVMPVYNGKNYFEQALKSAIIAISDDDEIIVVEDGSKDGGVENIVIKYSNQAKIRYFFKSNGGVGSALNLGIEKASNKIFAWLSHDDMYLPNRFDKDRQLRSLMPEIVTVSNFYLYYDDIEKCIHIDSTKKIGGRQKVKLLGSRSLNGNCLLAPINLLKSMGGFDESLKHTQDYDLWCRILSDREFVAIPDATVVSRQHSGQDSKRQPAQALKEYKQLLRKYLKQSDIVNLRNLPELVKIIKNYYGL